MCEALRKEVKTEWKNFTPPRPDSCCMCWDLVCGRYTPGVMRFGVKMFYAQMAKPYLPQLKACDQTEITVPERDGNDSPVKLLMFRPKAMPKSSIQSAPAIIYIHGGAYMAGSADQTAPLCAHDAVEHSAVVFSVDLSEG